MTKFKKVSEAIVDSYCRLGLLLDLWEGFNNSHDSLGNETQETQLWKNRLKSDFDDMTEAEFINLYKVAAFWEACELDEIECTLAPERILAREKKTL